MSCVQASRALSRQLSCKLQDKMNSVTEKRNARLHHIRELSRNMKRRAEAVRARKQLVHVKPLNHGISLLSDLPPTPDVVVRPPSRGGVAFEVTDAYKLLSMPPRVMEEKKSVNSEVKESVKIEVRMYRVNIYLFTMVIFCLLSVLCTEMDIIQKGCTCLLAIIINS